MKWTYFIQQKLKVASLLFGVMLLVIITDLIERRNVERINNSVSSIYNDRLIPAADIFYLTDHLYNKSFLLEKFLIGSPVNIQELRQQLSAHDRDIARLTGEFEKTYLVETESAFLNEFKLRVANYGKIETEVVQLAEQNNVTGARSLFEGKAKPALKNTILTLSDLTKVQTLVGSELLEDSKGIIAMSNFLSALQVVLAIVIGVIIMSLVSASKLVSSAKGDFNLN